MEPRSSRPRVTRIRRRVGLALLLGCFALAAVLIVRIPTARMETYWLVYHYLWIPGPLAAALGAILLLPDSWRRKDRSRFWRFWGGVSWVALFVLAAATAGKLYYLHGFDSALLRLENPGRFEAAILEAHGRGQIDSTVWARPVGGDRFEIVASPDYPPCAWPIELRRSGAGARYLAVDSRGWAVVLYDLDAPEIARVFEDLPPIDDLRREFGADLVRVSTREAQTAFEEGR